MNIFHACSCTFFTYIKFPLTNTSYISLFANYFSFKHFKHLKTPLFFTWTDRVEVTQVLFLVFIIIALALSTPKAGMDGNLGE